MYERSLDYAQPMLAPADRCGSHGQLSFSQNYCFPALITHLYFNSRIVLVFYKLCFDGLFFCFFFGLPDTDRLPPQVLRLLGGACLLPSARLTFCKIFDGEILQLDPISFFSGMPVIIVCAATKTSLASPECTCSVLRTGLGYASRNHITV